MDQQKFLGLLDMLDGGGMGRSGQTFEGGPLSGFLNALGVRPMGYRERMEQQAAPGLLPRPMAGGSSASNVGNMTTEELVKLVEAALARPSTAPNSVYAPGAIQTSTLPRVDPYRFSPYYVGTGPQ